MDIDLIIVLLRHILRIEALGSERILSHEARCNSLVDLGIKLLDRTDALSLLAVLCLPYRKRGTPVTAARKVPVLDILKPLTETACSCRLRLPCNLLIEFHHSLANRCSLDEP